LDESHFFLYLDWCGGVRAVFGFSLVAPDPSFQRDLRGNGAVV